MISLSIILKSFSEVFFQENALFGLLILLGLAVVSPVTALLALIGNISANITGGFLETNKGLYESGVYGFSGILIGAAVAFYLKNLPLSIGIVIVGSVVAAFMAYILLKNQIPPLALPFVIVTLCIVFLTKYFKTG